MLCETKGKAPRRKSHLFLFVTGCCTVPCTQSVRGYSFHPLSPVALGMHTGGTSCLHSDQAARSWLESPTDSRLRLRLSLRANCLTRPCRGPQFFGASETRHFGESGIRTHDLRITSPTLYHSATAAEPKCERSWTDAYKRMCFTKTERWPNESVKFFQPPFGHGSGFVQDWFGSEQIILVQDWFVSRTVPVGWWSRSRHM